MALPLLPDFAVRLAAGLAGLLLLTPWRVVPPAFFRTHCLVILGLLVLAALFLGTGGAAFGLAVGGAVLAYVASIGWGLGLRRIGAPATLGVLVLTVALLLWPSQLATLRGLMLAGRLTSAFLLGSTLSAMLLGHHYLIASGMSISPLQRFVGCMALALGIRTILALLGLLLLGDSSTVSGIPGPLFLAMRWGIGLIGTAMATALAWQTVRIRSTQSATGILYIAMTFVLVGELTGMIVDRDTALGSL
jgi:hypothetical protein